MPNLDDFAENAVLRAALSHGVRPLGGTRLMAVACEGGARAQAGVLEKGLRPKCSATDCGETRHVIWLEGGTVNRLPGRGFGLTGNPCTGNQPLLTVNPGEHGERCHAGGFGRGKPRYAASTSHPLALKGLVTPLPVANPSMQCMRRPGE